MTESAARGERPSRSRQTSTPEILRLLTQTSLSPRDVAEDFATGRLLSVARLYIRRYRKPDLPRRAEKDQGNRGNRLRPLTLPTESSGHAPESSTRRPF